LDILQAKIDFTKLNNSGGYDNEGAEIDTEIVRHKKKLT
jgi:hypothetical protein